MPIMDSDVCPNCGRRIEGGILSKKVYFITGKRTKLLNKYLKKEESNYCNLCWDKYSVQVSSEINSERERRNMEIEKLRHSLDNTISALPILTTHTPLNWDYDSLGIVTAQSVTGTGVIAELVSDITDFVGVQSGIYSEKLSKGETLCFNQLRTKTLKLGGNAIIAADIDFSEAGGLKGMLMVCMAGTAVKLKNLSVLGDPTAKNLEKIDLILKRLNDLESLEPLEVPEDM